MKLFRREDDLCDVVSLVIHCLREDCFLLVQDHPTDEYWFPCSKSKSKSKSKLKSAWRESARRLQKDLGIQCNQENLCKLYRIWTPNNNYIHHAVFEARVTTFVRRTYFMNVQSQKYKCRWMKASEILKNYLLLRSPEMLDIVGTIRGRRLEYDRPPAFSVNPEGSWTDLLECDYNSDVVEVREEHVLHPLEDTLHKELLQQASFTPAVQKALFANFLVQCFPCLYMNLPVFVTYMDQLGWSKQAATRMFRAADTYARGFLSYRDLLYVMAALEPNTAHGGAAGEIRGRYIFRFYDENNDYALDTDEVAVMVSDVLSSRHRSAGRPPPPASNNVRALRQATAALGLQERPAAGLDCFLRSIGNLQIRGLSSLLRSRKSILGLLAVRSEKTPGSPDHLVQYMKSPKRPADVWDIPRETVVQVAQAGNVAGLGAGGRRSSVVSGGRASRAAPMYKVAVHSVKIKRGGTAIDVDLLWDLGPSVYTGSSVFTSRMQAAHRPSVDAFDTKAVQNEVLRGLQYFAQPIEPKGGKKAKAAFSWGLVDPAGFANCMLTLCEQTGGLNLGPFVKARLARQVRLVLEKEPRLLELNSPVYVLGDLHGNFNDLMYFEKVLWYLGPSLSPGNLLFLGDYVDRGPHGIEIISYLFAYKLQCPNKVKLLRGNHEVREVQKMFTFQTECVHKFGETLGMAVWNAANAAMDCLPLAAIVDEVVFCVHGGIPPPWLCPVMGTISAIPCPLPNPDVESPLAWELMWNDPVKPERITDSVKSELATNDGFAVNTTRGTGHMFTSDALDRFLQMHGFSHVIRAHQMMDQGFQLQQRQKMINVFSASKYCNNDNDAACVLVDSGKIRAFRI